MAQTPTQRKANLKFQKDLDSKRGKPTQEVKKKQDFKSPVSPMVLGILGFVVFGGLVFELISRFFLS
ncbi:related to secretory pathway protein YSY6 [Rhynchosporium agropyri]|uniref:Stress-associated endoplasmic reticulum protein n=2 Tax=Rhynchosporium TaxID=38037 RepID=A0A1E1MEF3_RHYSE|nr:related to secretory pathway protein YSY6 [Rhynchosporium agropyri]CZT47486.1 related to secretory pathway protein YSY6 [Rhynchosporium secalis]